MGKWQDTLNELRSPVNSLREMIPLVWSTHVRETSEALQSGELDQKSKELIALSIAIIKRCDGCIASHAKNLARLRVSAKEVAEAIGVCIMMDGGPATVYGPRAIEAFLEFDEYYSERKGSTS